MGGDKFPFEDTPVNVGKSVVVIGAGNTAMDCLRVARRLGVPKVRCVYRRSEAEAPARIEELRHAKEEGVEFFFLHAPNAIHVNADGDVAGMRAQRMALGEPDEKGRRKPVPLDEYVELDCDTVVYALGTKANPIITQSTPGLAVNKWGNIVADDVTQATSVKGVFAGGDIVTGGATVILAMGAGRRAAKAIARYLRSGKRWPLSDASVEVSATEKRVCPKCRKPIEDGAEEYVCCAGESLMWRCERCHKVSEGFAFPYGMCPSCGGHLVATSSAPVEGAAALDAIRMAFEIELGGQAFYLRAASDTADPELKDLFTRFAAMEEEHMATLSRRYHATVPAPNAEFQVERAAMYAGIPHHPADPANLFRIAIAFERRAVEFFETRGAATAEGSVENRLYAELAAEESEHVAILSTELDRWSRGRAGLL